MVQQISSGIRGSNQLYVYIFHAQPHKKLARGILKRDPKCDSVSRSFFEKNIIIHKSDWQKPALYHISNSMLCTSIPEPNEQLKSQDSTTDVNEEYFQNLFLPPLFLPIHRIYQLFCFLVFLGPFKLFFSLLTLLLWAFVIIILPTLKTFFPTNLNYKLFVHTICKLFLRLFLFFMGVINISINGNVDSDVRFFVSNHLSLLDFAIHFCSTAVTFVQTIDSYRINKILDGKIFKIFRLKLKKKKISYQLTNCASDPSYFPLLIFPEGSPTNGDAIIRFSPDAFESEYAVQPVTLQYNLYFTPRGFNSLYWGDHNILSLIMRILCTPFITCSITYLKKQDTKTEIIDSSASAKKCQLRIANELGVLATSNGIASQDSKLD